MVNSVILMILLLKFTVRFSTVCKNRAIISLPIGPSLSNSYFEVIEEFLIFGKRLL